MLRTSGDDGPYSFAPLATAFATCALGNAAIDDHESHRLFREVVGRLHARRGDKAEVGLAEEAKTLGALADP